MNPERIAYAIALLIVAIVSFGLAWLAIGFILFDWNMFSWTIPERGAVVSATLGGIAYFIWRNK